MGADLPGVPAKWYDPDSILQRTRNRRVGEYRLFYTIDEQEVIVVVVVDLRRRQNCYRKSDQRAVGSHHDDGRMPKSLQIVVSLLE